MKDEINQKIIVENRRSIFISGIKKIVSFDPLEFYIETNMGGISIKGKDLELTKMDDSSINIKGLINGFNYIEIRNKENSFINKLFK